MKIGYTDINLNQNRYISLDPAYPHMYLPASDFTIVSERINTLSNARVCSLEKGNCMFEQPCTLINQANISIQLSLGDGLPEVVIPTQHMYIPGDQLNDSEDRCYLPIFR